VKGDPGFGVLLNVAIPSVDRLDAAKVLAASGETVLDQVAGEVDQPFGVVGGDDHFTDSVRHASPLPLIKRLPALDSIPTEQKRLLAESGVLTANYESTIKDGFTALETYLKSRFAADARAVSLAGKRAVFQRLDEAAGSVPEHLSTNLRGLVGQQAWRRLLRVAAMRHVLTHNAGIVDTKFLEREPGWPQAIGQHLHVSEEDASGLLLILTELARILRPR
jgi:hypothetical protein